MSTQSKIHYYNYDKMGSPICGDKVRYPKLATFLDQITCRSCLWILVNKLVKQANKQKRK